jgi:hypothetical protein
MPGPEPHGAGDEIDRALGDGLLDRLVPVDALDALVAAPAFGIGLLHAPQRDAGPVGGLAHSPRHRPPRSVATPGAIRPGMSSKGMSARRWSASELPQFGAYRQASRRQEGDDVEPALQLGWRARHGGRGAVGGYNIHAACDRRAKRVGGGDITERSHRRNIKTCWRPARSSRFGASSGAARRRRPCPTTRLDGT